MADVEIKGRISVDAGQAQKSTNDYIDALKQAKKAVNEAKIGSVEYKKAQEDLAKATKDLDRSVAQSGGSFGKLKDTLGSTVPGFKSASAGAEGLQGKLMALVANPIGMILAAIVLTLTFLFKAFTSTAEGGKKLEQVLEGLKAAFQVVTDRVFALGNAVIKFFSGDFAGAAKDAKAAVTGIGDEIERVYKQTASITKRLQEIKKEQRADDLDKAQREKRLAMLREQLNDENVSLAEKKRIARELRQDQIVNAADDLKRSTEEANLKIKLLTQQKDGAKKNADEINQLRIGIYKTETENALEMVRTNKVIRNLDKQGEAEQLEAHRANVAAKKAIDDKAKKAEEDWAKKKAADFNALNLELIAIDKTGLDMLKEVDAEKDRLHQSEIERGSSEMQIIAENYEAKKQLATQELEHKRGIHAAAQNLISDAMTLFGKQTIAGKGLAMAQALLNTYTGATDALRAKSVLPSPFDVVAKVANVAAVIATGFQSIRAIGKVNVPGGGGGSVSTPAMPTLSASAPLSPTQTSTALNAGSIQGIGNAASGGVSRSFVLESDITNNRERAERINRAARLG